MGGLRAAIAVVLLFFGGCWCAFCILLGVAILFGFGTTAGGGYSEKEQRFAFAVSMSIGILGLAPGLVVLMLRTKMQSGVNPTGFPIVLLKEQLPLDVSQPEWRSENEKDDHSNSQT